MTEEGKPPEETSGQAAGGGVKDGGNGASASNEDGLQKFEQKFMSWIGRRDKELLGQVGDMVNSIRSELIAAKKEPEKPIDGAEMIADPERVINTVLTKREVAANAYKQSVINTIGSLMQKDDTYADQELGGAVVDMVADAIKNNSLNFDVRPEVEADRLLSRFTAKALKTKAGTPKTAFDGRGPTDKKTGTMKAGDAKVAAKAAVPDLDELSARMVKRWGYKPEDIERVFNKGKDAA